MAETAIDRATFVREWCKDLRSGEYKQGFSKLLRTDGSRCCLGVACCTARRLGISDAREDAAGFVAPDDWFEKLMGSRNPDIGTTNCMLANDVHGMTFATIADALEARYCGATP